MSLQVRLWLHNHCFQLPPREMGDRLLLKYADRYITTKYLGSFQILE